MPYKEFKERVAAELADTDADWLRQFKRGVATYVETESNRFWANETERALVQKMGEAYGCHTCNKAIADASQSFIVDHIPPKELASAKGVFRYFPHCDTCASTQSALVRAVKGTTDHARFVLALRDNANRSSLARAAGVLKELKFDDEQILLLCGGDYALSIPGRRGNPNDAERQAVDAKGSCHSCGTQQASSTYHADHCPPREIGMTSWFPKVMKELGAPLDDEYFFRPQCPSCSHQQGARCRKLVAEAATIAGEIGVIRYTA